MKNVRQFSLALACLVPFFGLPAAAANWVYVTKSANGSVYYYDADTVQRSGDLITAWEKSDHSNDKTKKERESKDRYRYDCSNRTSTLLNSINYYPDGASKSFTWENYEQKNEPVIPETIGEAILEAVCAATAP